MLLTKEQLESFHKNGFLVIKDFAPKDLCDEILQKAKEHLEKKQEPNG